MLMHLKHLHIFRFLMLEETIVQTSVLINAALQEMVHPELKFYLTSTRHNVDRGSGEIF